MAKMSRLEHLNPNEDEGAKRIPSREENILDILDLVADDKTCALMLEEDVDLLRYRYDIDATNGTSGFDELDCFMSYGASPRETPFYLVIHNIDQADNEIQSDFFGLVKDRKLITKPALLDDYIVIFTISSLESKKNILYNLYNFAADLTTK